MLSCFREKSITVRGLMTIGPNTRDKGSIRGSFVLLRELKDEINNQLGENRIKELSMGMSGDYEIAIEEGSTMIRLGTALFGQRGK